MKILVILHNLACLCGFVFAQSDVRKPPSITISPKRSDIFREGDKVELGCKAEGIPAVTYAWKKNGVDLNLNLRNINFGPDGNLEINPATKMDEGFYQCFASNQFGTALSNRAHIQKAFLDSTPQSSIVSMTVQEGRPFVISAARRNSLPKPTNSWQTVLSPVDRFSRQLHPTQRMQIACNGDLYFAYAEKADERDGNIYKSVAYNPVLDLITGGSYTQVTVTGSGYRAVPEFAPNITYSSVSPNVTLVGGNVTLKCFFSGKPLPSITWAGPSGSLPRERSTISHFETELTISKITEADEGNYVCTGTNTKGFARHNLRFRVDAEPKFTQESDGPRNVNATEGASVTFNCRASAKPEADVVWLQNGQPIDVNNAPTRFAFSDDKKSLTIRDVCRDCPDRERPSDLMVIQCNASNVHGYAFASGYLNVLRRTNVSLSGSTFVSVDLSKENQFHFNCSATSDPSTPPTVRWYRVGPQGQELVYTETPYVYVMNGNLAINTEPNCSDSCHKYLGEYRCVADNGYSQDFLNVTLNDIGFAPVSIKVEQVTSFQYESHHQPVTTVTVLYEGSAPGFAETDQVTSFPWLLVLIVIIGLLIATIGFILGWRVKRCNAAKKRAAIVKDAEIPHPNSIYEDIGYDSVDVLPEKVSNIYPADNMYEHVGYDSIDLPLEEARTSADINQPTAKSKELNPYTDLAREAVPPPVYTPLLVDHYIVPEN